MVNKQLWAFLELQDWLLGQQPLLLKSNILKKVKFGILIALNAKTAVIWTVMPCSLADDYQCFQETYCVHLHGGREWSSMFLQNVSNYLPDHTL
jgi:hypothetical protein